MGILEIEVSKQGNILNMLKKFLLLSIPFILNNFATPILSQEHSGCFMVGVQGRLFDLDPLCNGESTQIITEEPSLEGVYNPDSSGEKEEQTISSLDVSCDMFSTQHQAQEYFLKNRSINMDIDENGIVCKNLPSYFCPISRTTHNELKLFMAERKRQNPMSFNNPVYLSEVQEIIGCDGWLKYQNTRIWKDRETYKYTIEAIVADDKVISLKMTDY